MAMRALMVASSWLGPAAIAGSAGTRLSLGPAKARRTRLEALALLVSCYVAVVCVARPAEAPAATSDHQKERTGTVC